MSNGLQIKYSELLTLSVEQAFYENGICKRYQAVPMLDTTIVPTPECMRLMTRLDMVFKNTDQNGGFAVYARTLGVNAAGNSLLRFPVKADYKLSFWILLNNPEVLNFNDLSAQLPADQFYYFSNQVTDAAALRNNLHLTIDATGVKSAGDNIKQTTSAYLFHNAVVVAPNTAKVKHLLTGISIDPVSVINTAGQADLSFDLSQLPSGKCILFINNAQTDVFYYMGAAAAPAVFAVIELSLSALLDANYRIAEADQSLTPQRPLYKVHFINRSTIWRYIIHLESNSPLYLEIAALSAADKITFMNELNIVSNDTGMLFKLDSSTATDFAFVSQTTVPLRETYVSASSTVYDLLSLTLKKYIGNAAQEAAVKSNLSYPSTSSIDALVSPNIYSDVFITI